MNHKSLDHASALIVRADGRAWEPWEAPTLDRVECADCNAEVADRPFPPTDDDTAWSLEALSHRLGCAAILTRAGSRPAPIAPTWARGTHYQDGDPGWGRTLDGARLIPLDVLKDGAL